MRYIRFETQNQPPTYGWIQDDRVGLVEGNLFAEYRRTEAHTPLERVTLLPPVQPSKIICVGRNYVAHAKEMDNDVPEIPLLFFKPPSSLLSDKGAVVLPPQSKQVEHEGELVVVIGRKGRWIAPEDAVDYIFGYTIGNDITARDLQRSDSQWTRGKGFDTFCPIGPWIDTDFDPADALLECRVNGEIRQMASTQDMVFTVRQIISFASSVMTLEPGDIIMTGTPAGVSPLQPGDTVEVSINGIGTLSNQVIKEQRP